MIRSANGLFCLRTIIVYIVYMHQEQSERSVERFRIQSLHYDTHYTAVITHELTTLMIGGGILIYTLIPLLFVHSYKENYFSLPLLLQRDNVICIRFLSLYLVIFMS